MRKLPGGWRGIHRRNWSAGPQATHDPDIVPSAWDKLLREMQLSEAQALELLAKRKDKAARRITAFVMQNKDKKFIPELALITLGEITW
jgi:hypothetical protein